MNTDRDRFLTECFGECWHELEPEKHPTYFMKANGGGRCIKCGQKWNPAFAVSGFNSQYYRNEVYPEKVNRDLSTWGGFGWLWEQCQKQEWWGHKSPFWAGYTAYKHHGKYLIGDAFINPDGFANAIYKFLKEDV